MEKHEQKLRTEDASVQPEEPPLQQSIDQELWDQEELRGLEVVTLAGIKQIVVVRLKGLQGRKNNGDEPTENTRPLCGQKSLTEQQQSSRPQFNKSLLLLNISHSTH